MNSPKSNKFKVGDKVKVISHKNTVKRFGGDSDDLAEIETEGIVNNVTGVCVGIEGNMWLLDVDDVILLDKTESVNDIKIGDSVEFLEYFGISKWEAKYGIDVGDVVTVTGLDGNCVRLMTKTNQQLWVYSSQVLKCSPTTSPTEGIESDGGSSSYYFTKLPKHLIDQIVETGGIEIKDIVRYVFDNNADAFNIVKAQKRIIEANKGKGKSGITGLYDMNKVVYFANEQLKAMKNKEG